jgi:hypothetical protein
MGVVRSLSVSKMRLATVAEEEAYMDPPGVRESDPLVVPRPELPLLPVAPIESDKRPVCVCSLRRWAKDSVCRRALDPPVPAPKPVEVGYGVEPPPCEGCSKKPSLNRATVSRKTGVYEDVTPADAPAHDPAPELGAMAGRRADIIPPIVPTACPE